MGLGPEGWLEGNTDQITMACDFIIDFNDFMIYMQDFRLVSLGSIDIRVRGNPLVDWLSNLIIQTVSKDMMMKNFCCVSISFEDATALHQKLCLLRQKLMQVLLC